MLLALTLAQFADLLTFALMVDAHGIGMEANPVIVDMYGALGLPGLALAKLLAVVSVSGLYLVLRGPYPRSADLLVGVGIAAGAVGAVTNTLSI